MTDWLHSFPPLTMALLVCAGFVSFTWIGIIFIRPFALLFVRGQSKFNGILGNFL